MSIHTVARTHSALNARCDLGTTLFDVAERITELDVNALAVVDEAGHVRGIVTDHDIIRVIVKRDDPLHRLAVDDVMTSPVITCERDTGLSEALTLMGRHRIRHLIVVQDGLFDRVLPIKDLLEAIHRDNRLEANVLREMALGRLAEAG